MRRVRLVIADRRPIVLQGFVSLLEAQPDFEVVACCLDGASCLAAIRRLTPDVVLLEDGFTDVTASDMLAVMDDEDLSSRLVFFTATVSCSDLASALATGACSAISMNAKPEALVQSLRLENRGPALGGGDETKGKASFGNNVLAVLTVNERTIMDLVAEGLSDREIARMLGVSLEIVRIHIDHARQKLGSNSRTELAALALSRRSGAMSILIAAILAALDDSPGHAATESFTVAADDDAGIVTIKIGRKDAVSDGAPARGAGKDRAGGAAATSSPTAKLVDPVTEMAASHLAQAAPNAPRPGSSGYSIFMAAAFAAFIYELDGANHTAQAFDFGDDIVTSTTVSDAIGLASALPDFADFGGTAVYDGAFAFEFAQGDPIATGGSELHVHAAYAEDGGSDRQAAIPQGSGAIDVVAAAANDAAQGDSTQAGRDDGASQGQSRSDLRASDNSSEAARHEAARDDLNHGQSQKALRESDDSSGATKGHAKNEAAGDGLNHGQSQKALHESDNGSGTAKGHAKHEAAGDGLNHGQSQKALHEANNGSEAAKGHAKHEAAGDGLNHGQSQKALHEADSGSGAAKGHAKLEAQGENSNLGPAQSDQTFEGNSAAGKQLGHSFHFESGADNSTDMHDLQHLIHGNGKAYADSRHVVARQGPEPVQDADGIDISDAPHDHSWHANLHTAHDLIV